VNLVEAAKRSAGGAVHTQTSALRSWVLVAGIALVLVIVAADAFEGWEDYQATRSENESIQMALSRALAEQTSRMVQEADVVLADYATWMISGDGQAAREEQLRERLRVDVLRLPFVYAATVAGADGHILATTQDDPIANRSLDKREAFTAPQHATDNALYVGRPFTGRRDGSRTFTLSRRINTKAGQFGGVVVARVAFEYLASFYAGVDVTPGTSIRLVRSDGTTLAQYPLGDGPIADDLDLRRLYASVVRSSGKLNYLRADGVDRVVAFQAIQGYPIVVEVNRSLSSVMEPWIRHEIWSTVRTFLLVLLAAGLVLALRLALGRHDRLDQQRRGLEHDLAAAQRADALGFLAASMAHDFNNVLTAIVGYAELIRGSLAPGTIANNVDRLLSATERARLLVRRVLTFDPNRSLSYVPVAVGPVVAEVLQQIQATLPQSVSLQASGLVLPATILGDATEVYQIIMNLCTNAVRAMPSGGVLLLKLEAVEITEPRDMTLGAVHPGTWICLAVGDQGSGMTKAELKLAFDRFYTTRPADQGTGIGLTVVRNIILRMQGALAVDSQVGSGTTMSVYWPSIAAGAQTSLAGRSAGRGESILILDDEVELVALAEDLLASLGYEPVGFADPEAALACVRREPGRYQAVLTDERMPNLRGTEFARRVRAIAPAMPVILMTGHRNTEIEVRAREAGIVEILDKPLRLLTLQAALERACVHRPSLGDLPAATDNTPQTDNNTLPTDNELTADNKP